MYNNVKIVPFFSSINHNMSVELVLQWFGTWGKPL